MRLADPIPRRTQLPTLYPIPFRRAEMLLTGVDCLMFGIDFSLTGEQG